MKNRNRKAGIALVIALLTILVLAVLMGSFFKAYSSHYSLTRASLSSQAAATGCESVFQYVVYRLEHDRNWGSNVFPEINDPPYTGPLMEVTEVPGTHTFRGELTELNVRFEATIHSNLADVVDEESAALVGRGRALCRVVCEQGPSKRRAEFMLNVAPMFDSSVLTRADLRVDSQSLAMRSRDPYRNFLRAEGDIYVPDILTGTSSRFMQPDSSAPDANGMLWAKGDIHSYYGGGQSERINEASELADAARNSNGKIVPNADSHFSIFDLDSQDLKLSEDQQSVSVWPGRWNFVRTKARVEFTGGYANAVPEEGNSGNLRPVVSGGSQGGERGESGDVIAGTDPTVVPDPKPGVAEVDVDVLEYYPPGETTPRRVFRSAHRTVDLEESLPESRSVQVSAGRDSFTQYSVRDSRVPITTTRVTILGYEQEVSLVGDAELAFGESGGPQMVFDLTNQRVTADPKARVEVDGPFQLTSDRESPPVLDLGFREGSSGEEMTRATIIANETINIENGVTEGLGALISRQGDVKIQPINSSDVDIDASRNDSGLLLYAGGDVVLSNPDSTENWDFKGLVYARGGVKMKGSQAERATFEGSVVALQENEPEGDAPNGIEFEDCGDIEFIYNSELLDSFLNNLKGHRVQLETVVWKR